MFERIKKTLLAPLNTFKLRYLPLLMIYFAYGLSGFSTIALSFWKKEQLGLSAEQLLSIAAWAAIPWTAKVVAGQLVDSVAILGSRRRVYIFIGAVFMVAGTLILAGLAGRHDWVMWFGSEYTVYLVSAVLTVIGFVIQDVTADTMTTEVIDRTQLIDGELVDRDPQSIQADLASVQVLGRIALYLSSFSVAGFGGWLAANYDYELIFWAGLLIPIISCLGAVFVRLDPIDTADIKPINKPIFMGGIAFILFSIVMGLSNFSYAQELVFVVSAIFLCTMLWLLIQTLDVTTRKTLIFTLLAIFLYRAVPSVGPGASWWMIDVLKFDQVFFGVLAQIGAFTGLIVLWLSADMISRGAIRTTLIVLICVESILFVPDLVLYYDAHQALGLDAKTIALFDSAAESPLVSISMVIVLSLIAFHAPAGNRGTWFAVAASFTNLALTAGHLLSKYLNKLFVVSREVTDDAGVVLVEADYSALGSLIWVVLAITFIMPMLAVLTLLKKNQLDQE